MPYISGESKMKQLLRGNRVKNLIILILNDTLRDRYNARYATIDREDVQYDLPYCQQYGNAGIKIACHEAGCYSPENSACDWEDGDNEAHIGCTAINYHDGHNWKSIIVEHDHVDPSLLDANILDDEDEIARIQCALDTADTDLYEINEAKHHHVFHHFIN